MDSIRQAWTERRLMVILIVILLILIGALICVLAFQSLFGGSPTPTTGTPVAGETPTVATSLTVEPSPTATRVVGGDEPTATGTPAPVGAATPTPAGATPARNTPTPAAGQIRTTRTPAAPGQAEHAEAPIIVTGNVLRNGDFEFGFDERGVALNWGSFNNGGAVYLFSDERWLSAIKSGAHAQRITVLQSSQPNRHAGIYQIVSVVPGETYWLTLHGQIRIRAGSDQVGKQSYRMEYAFDYSGGDEWEFLPEDEWVELPWDEQIIDAPGVTFLKHKIAIVPPNPRLTLFVRAWNKWPDPGEAQYTLDSLSLVGPTAAAETMMDQPLPATGQGGAALGLPADPRIWASLTLLLLLLGGALWRARYGKNS